MEIKVIVASHKPYWMPVDPVYQPLQVGAAGKETFGSAWLRDDRGRNISERNPSYCELTGLYWMWKNLDADVLGLCHYRRYFGTPVPFPVRLLKEKKARILTGPWIEMLLRGADIILPGKRQYWIETRESQYAHAHHAEDLRVAETVLQERYPDFIPAWRHMLSSHSGHICNMLIARRELMDEYCTWLFGVLFECEKRLDISAYSGNDRRVFGFLGERLLDAWVETKQLRYTEVPILNLESQRWIKKGTAFLRRKYGHEKLLG